MTTRDDIYAAIRNADKAGDTASVQKLAAYLQTMPADTAPQHVNSPEMTAKIDNDAISQDAKSGPSLLGEIGRQIGNLGAGAVRGAGSIGATIMYPVDKAQDLYYGDRGPNVTGLVTGQQPLSRNQERRASMDWSLGDMGADTKSPAYAVGKVGAEIAGTAGAGGLIANGTARALPAVAEYAPNLLNAIRTSGMVAAPAGTTAPVVNALTRAAGGAITGGASAGLVDPSNAGSGALIGGAIPIVTKTAGAVGSYLGSKASDLADSAAHRLMQSAIKPTIAQLRSGEADTAVNTLLDYGINPTRDGVNKLQALIDDKNTQIANAIGSSTASIPKQNVLAALAQVRTKFGNQVSPTSDLATIGNVEQDFLNHPNYPGADIPVQAAQEMKKGTYQVLKGKFGQVGSADTEAQKGLARGLKEEIANAVPAVGPLNAEESRLITTLNVTERRALMEMNKNPMGLAALAHNPIGWAAFMADKSALFKSLAARAVNSVSGAPNALQGVLSNDAASQLGYQVAPNALADR